MSAFVSPQSHAQPVHKEVHLVGHKKAAVEAAKKAADEEAKREAASANETAEQAFESTRDRWAQLFIHMKAAPDNPRGARLIEALRPVALKFLQMPMKLVSKTESGDRTVLVFKAKDPSTDIIWSCTATKAGNEWLLTNQDFKGRNAVDIAIEPYNAIASVFPSEISTITTACMIFVVSSFAAFASSIFLIIAAFRVSVLWGLVVFFVPFGNIIFAICRWREARIPFVVNLICFCFCIGALAIPITVVQSLKDVGKIMPDFMPTMSDEQTTQLIENGLKNSKGLKLKKLGPPEDVLH
ncbi:MAG: hypothetical protein JST89_13040 [Cyanobacteria bacterium SZAS-4]|nr:hypothetical protein [Cyanobacteria bacterium SZAS-4]